MEVTVRGQHIRIAPRKVRLVIDLIRGEDVTPALEQLSVSPKGAALVVRKLVSHAVAAAEGKKMAKDRLFIKRIVADGGPQLKRFRPRAFGRASTIRKRTTHLTLTLGEHPAPAKPVPAKPTAQTPLKKAS